MICRDQQPTTKNQKPKNQEPKSPTTKNPGCFHSQNQKTQVSQCQRAFGLREVEESQIRLNFVPRNDDATTNYGKARLIGWSKAEQAIYIYSILFRPTLVRQVIYKSRISLGLLDLKYLSEGTSEPIEAKCCFSSGNKLPSKQNSQASSS